MDIRSRAESLRPVRYFLSRGRDQEPDSAGTRLRPDAPDGGSFDRAAGQRSDSAGPDPVAGGAAIAIIGMGCRFPDADDPAALLDVVLTGRRAFRRLPPGRLDLADYYSADRATPDATYSARAAVLEGWQFDLAAFGVPPAAYQAADPAHWLALETAARALAAAGFAFGQGLARSRTGVVIGNSLTGDASRAAALRLRWPYVRRVLAEALAAGDIPQERAAPVLRYAEQRYLAPFPPVTDETLGGSMPGAIAARICGYFGFRGGGYAVDGSHASSLLAVASACAALAAGDLDVALAGGVDLGLDPLELVGLAKAGALARGEMRVYDENPTGFLPGEGCGMVVLMRSDDARVAGLPVYAEIAGWGAASAGQAAASVPDAHSQFLALHRAYQRARLAPADVHLIEGHGAGTAGADSTELSALAELRAGARRVAALGSIKANIGNAKAAAGVAGLIKTVLAMSTGFVPPATGFSRPHPLLRSGDAALRLPREPEPWPDGLRIAGVSSMGPGIGVHLVLRSEQPRGRHERRPRVSPRTARCENGLGGASLPGTGDHGRSTAFLVHAPDRNALGAVLGRIAHVAPWLSDAELGDLACQLGRDAGNQGPARLAIVASNQDQLARLASQGTALLSGLDGGLLASRPGIYAADGADGRVTLLLSDATGTAARDRAGRPGGLADAATEPRPRLPGAGERAGRGTPADHSSTPFRPLSTLRWLNRLGVRTTAAVGYGYGELAGLVWAQCLAGADAIALAATRAKILNGDASTDSAHVAGSGTPNSGPDDRADRLREAVRRLAIAEPRRRLISAGIGREVASPDDVAEILCAQLGCSPGLDRALRTGADGATLLLETGPGQALSQAASVLCDVPAVSLGSGSGAEVVRVVAALFAAGALQRPAELFAGRPSRPIDIWRERTFLTSPCQVVPAVAPSRAADRERDGAPAIVPAAAAPRAAGLAEAAAAARRAAAAERAAAAARAIAARGTTPAERAVAAMAAAPAERAATARTTTPAERAAAAGALAPAQRVASGSTSAPAGAPRATRATRQPMLAAGAGPWARCFTEELRPAAAPPAAAPPGMVPPAAAPPVTVTPDGDRAWRVRAATRGAFGNLVQELFPDDPAADTALAIVGDPANPDSCAVALSAARDAMGRGRLVLITHGPGFTGFCATLHAEHPELGITLLRVPESVQGLRAARRFAAADPGTFRELVIDAAGQPYDVVMTPAETPGSGRFPLGPDDVVLVSRGSGGAGLALTQVLACCGAPIALIGREGRGEAGEVEAGLERLRSAGVRMAVEDVDLASAADLGHALQRIERSLGPVTAVALAVSVGGPRPVAGLTEEELRAHICAVTASLDQMVSAITTRRLRLIITFGSIVGRYGLAGEGLLALASGALADRAERMSDAIAGCRGLHVDWPAWSGPGLGQRGSLAGALARSGTTAIPVREGSRLLLKAMATPGLPARLAVHGRVGLPGAAAAAGAAPPAGKLRGRFLGDVRVHYPGVELVCEARLTLRADPYLSDYTVDGIPVLPAAMALEAMAEAAAALTGRPMRRLTAVSMDAPVVVPAGADAHALIRICALRDGGSVRAVLRCAESGFATDHFRATFSDADDAAEAASLVTAMPELEEMPASHAGIVEGTELYGPICFQSGRFRRAALLPEVTSRSCRALVRGGNGQPWFGDLPGSSGPELLLGDPGLNDATWHVLQASVPHRRLLPAGCEAVTFSGREADGAVEIRAVATRPADHPPATNPAARPRPATPWPARLRARAIPEQRSAAPVSLPPPLVMSNGQGPAAPGPSSQATEYVWDVEAVDAAGRSLATWRGLRLGDVGPLPRTAAWSPSLLSVYLERGAVALGLDPELRVTVQCGRPADAGAPGSGEPPGTADDLATVPIVVPKPAPFPDLPAAVGSGESAVAREVHGRGHLDGFVLRVQAPGAAACGWEAAVPGAAPGPEPSQGLADVERELRSSRGESPAVTGARLRAVAACLAMASASDVSLVSATSGTDEDWLLLRAAGATLACTVVEITGVSCPVAIAVMTGDARQHGELRNGSGRRSRHSAKTPGQRQQVASGQG
jgi:enediyne polyketide synthase